MSIEKPTLYAQPNKGSADKTIEGHITDGWKEITRTPDDGSQVALVPGFYSLDRNGNHTYEPGVRLRHEGTERSITVPLGEHERLQEAMRVLNETHPTLIDKGISAEAQIAAQGIVSRVPGRSQERSRVIPVSRESAAPVHVSPSSSEQSGEIAAPVSSDEDDPFANLWNPEESDDFDVERAAIRDTPEELAQRRAELAAHARRIDDLNAAENARVGRPEMGWSPRK